MNFVKFVTQQNKVSNHARVKRGWQWEPLIFMEEQPVTNLSLYVGQVSSTNPYCNSNHNDFSKSVFLISNYGLMLN